MVTIIALIALTTLAGYNGHHMVRKHKLVLLAVVVALSLPVLFIARLNGARAVTEVTATGGVCDISKDAFCVAPRAEVLLDSLQASTIPKLATPDWLETSEPATRVVTYRVATKGTISADLDEFKGLTAEILNDIRGWSRLGVRFERVESGGDFTLYLSQASEMTSFSATGCDTTYSCNVGNDVVINEDRWLSPTSPWTEAGGSLSGYRAMVVNHETGHWLGHGHTYCSAAKQPATVMQQQSIDMQGCTPNAWPLAGELYAPKLGIRS